MLFHLSKWEEEQLIMCEVESRQVSLVPALGQASASAVEDMGPTGRVSQATVGAEGCLETTIVWD